MTAPRTPGVVPRIAGPWYWLAEAGCLALGVALAGSTVRLFSDGGPVVLLVAVAAAGWALAVGLRRSPLSPVASDLAHLGIGALALVVLAAPESRFGPLPTPASMQTLARLVHDDFVRFNDDIAPLDPGAGHMVVLATLTWLLALFCSTITMRLRAPVQGALPHVVAIIGLGVVARDQGRLAATVMLLGAVSVYALAQVAWRNSALRWIPAGVSGVARPFALGAAILAGAAIVTAAVSPLVPVGSDPTVDLRRGGLGHGGPRTVVSPFVEVGANLSGRSEDLLFTVEAQRPSYWRLTALDTYDPDEGIWVLSNSYAPVDGLLAPMPAEGTYDTETDIRTLGGIWIPAPPAPVTAEAPFALNWDRTSGSLISREDDVSAGDRIAIGASAARLSAEDLAGAEAASVPPELVDPGGVPASLAETAAVLAEGRTDYETAIALQNEFRNGYAYDETVDYSRSDDPLGTFVEERRGFCQQFSTAFALAARSVGLPARVVVGFTPGDLVEDGPDAGTYAVRGRHAHAWPEVAFEDLGWVSFEPTPGRGDPGSASVTGVAPAQAEPPAGSDTAEGVEDVTDRPTTTALPESAEGSPTSAPQRTEVSAAEEAGGDSDGGRSPWWPAVGLALAAVAAAVLVWSRRRAGPAARDGVRAAWDRALASLAGHGLVPDPPETPREFAGRAAGSLDAPAATALDELAVLESRRRWSPGGASPSHAERAERVADRLEAELRGDAGSQDEPVPDERALDGSAVG